MEGVNTVLYIGFWLACIITALSLILRGIIDTLVVVLGLFDFLWLKEKLIKLHNNENDALGIALICCAISWWLLFELKEPSPALLYIGGGFIYLIVFYWIRAHLFRWAERHFDNHS